MKKYIFPVVTILLLGWLSCEEHLSETVSYWINEPVSMDAEVFRNSVKVTQQVHEITGYGKISYYNGYLYISKPGKGIHIINNQHPEMPQKVGYIELLGNADLSVHNNILYADSYVDLVWFDVTNPALPELKGRLENVFPGALPFVDNEFGIDKEMSDSDKNKGKIIVGWEKVKRTVSMNDNKGWFWKWLKGEDLALPEINLDTNNGENSIKGSKPVFSLNGSWLYVIINNKLHTFDVKNQRPELVGKIVSLGYNIDTIYSNGTSIFLGTPTCMPVYSVKDPINPIHQATISNITSCNPFVVNDEVAYITFSSGNACNQSMNKLIVIDISDLSSTQANPEIIKTISLTSPQGLAVDNHNLFVCDNGLKVFDINDIDIIDERSPEYFKDYKGYEVLLFNNVLMMIADDGIYQYDYSDIQNIRKLSVLEIKN